jgi:uncharacterized LabA/DUF88 family protein
VLEKNHNQTTRLAVLIDADNANPNAIEILLKEIATYGTANVKRIYGDWTNNQLNCWKDKLNKLAIQPIQQFSYTTGKNSTDSALIIDAMDLLYTKNFDGFCIISSDSDFTRLASRIREDGLLVYGFGERKTPESFVVACDKFIYTEVLEESEDQSEEDTGSEVSKPSPSSSTPSPDTHEPKSPEENKKLVRLLKDAYQAIAGDDSWAHLGQMGTQLNKLSPSFDSRNYGYKKLIELVRAVGIFEVRETPHKHLKIKLKQNQ